MAGPARAKGRGAGCRWFGPADDVQQHSYMHALIGYLLIVSWTVMIWAAVKLTQDVRGAVRDWRHPRQHVHH
jgi:hypothetical protein